MPIKILRDFVKTCSQNSGIYQIYGEDSEIIYVGKAKNLKNRLSSYLTDLSVKTLKITQAAQKIEVVITNNEAEAFLLEANLIKKHQPKYNILLKDDKTFPFIKFNLEHEFPGIFKHRGKRERINAYFGPFSSSKQMGETIVMMQKAFLIRSCSNDEFSRRKRPCMLYQIKRCSAPCVNKISHVEYQAYVNEAKNFLSGNATKVREVIAQEMEKASEKLDYEKAAELRDRLKAINKAFSKQVIDLPDLPNCDCISVVKSLTKTAVAIFFIRGGQNFGSKIYFPICTSEATEQEVLNAFIGGFYQKNLPPAEIILSHKLEHEQTILEALKNLHIGVRTRFTAPKLGRKKELIDLATNNAKQALELEENEKQKNKKLSELLAEFFSLKNPVNTIEIYDNSHIFGASAVGAKVAWNQDGFDKDNYRKYNLHSSNIKGGDDYDMLKTVLLRRFRERKHLPDLLIIDGGKGHRSIVLDVLQELGLEIEFMCISKGIDRNSGNEIIIDKFGKEFFLDKNSELKKFIQILRDEAHRFAITSHRIRRKNQMLDSKLLKIPGIGAVRKRSLLNYFGSVDNIASASVQEIAKVPGISIQVAEQIYQFMHGVK